MTKIPNATIALNRESTDRASHAPGGCLAGGLGQLLYNCSVGVAIRKLI